MAIKMNLLPPEYVVSGAVGKVLSISRSLGVILLAGFIIFIIGLAGFFIISSIQLNSLTKRSDTLKAQISTREQSEQQLVLLKDRLKKIKTAQGMPSSDKNLSNLDPIIAAIPPNASLTELSADTQKVDVSISFRNNADLANFLKSISQIKTFKSALMTTFGFNPTSGYLVSVRFL